MDNTIVKNIASQGIDKTAIKNFAVYARNKLIKDIKNKAAMIGVTESGIQEPLSTSTGNIQLFDIGMQEPYRIEGKAIEQRNGLSRELKKRAQGSTYLTAYETLIEEVAYTWFNRIIAIRFMEVNNYMPDRIRVLSSGVEGINEPEFITHVFETSFQLSEEEKEHIIELKTDGNNLAMDELFQYLFIKQCNALNANLPELFEKTNDYTELLLTVSYNDVEGVIYKLVHDVPEMNFDMNSDNGNGQVEIIGWLYQYYNSERKDEVINVLGGKAIKKQDIPAATQLFTTDWVVRYMVDNSLGKYWMERNPHSDLADSLEYLVSKDIEEVDEKITPEDIKFLDNCMGSGHILVYAFDVLMKIYESEGYTTREAARLIVEKNFFGLEIDKRSYQLSYFAIMMKARQYNRRILNEELQNNLYVFQDSTSINKDHLQYLGNYLSNDERKQATRQLNYLIELFRNSEELGSIINVEGDFDPELLLQFIEDLDREVQISFDTIGIEETQQQLINLVRTAKLLIQKYEVVVTNPPYMNKFDKELKKYVKDKYKDYSGDLFSVFIYRNAELLVENGYSAYMTPLVWMFIKTYENLRRHIINKKVISSLIQLEYSAFEEATVPICTFILQNCTINKKGVYIKLSNFKGGMEVQRIKTIDAINDSKCNYVYQRNQKDFNKIPGSPIAYWESLEFINTFSNRNIGYYAIPKAGTVTGNDPYFVRFWHEVNFKEISFSESAPYSKYHLMQKGGPYRRYYGNNHYIIKLKDLFDETKTNKSVRRGDPNFYFKKGIGWSQIGSNSNKSFRVIENSICGTATPMIYLKNDKYYYYILGLLNTPISNSVMNILNPTINLLTTDVCRVPVIINDYYLPKINTLIQENIRYAKADWNSLETSWSFKRHPLLSHLRLDEQSNYCIDNGELSLKTIYEQYKSYTNSIFSNMKKNEEELNKIFIELYSLENELDHKVKDKDVSISRIYDSKDDIPTSMRGNQNLLTQNEIIKSFISYVVGCLFGRYSLMEDGIVYAGGEFTSEYYSSSTSKNAGIILVTENKYFTDDILDKFVNFISECYGEEKLEENLRFIEYSLNNSGNTAREKIRNYFINDFYKDHLSLYQKTPIYWLYDSGKQNGFKALVYMHRYDEDTIGKVRVDYLHQVQRAYERTINNLQEDIANSKDAKETILLQKQLEKITKQLKECRDYDERLGHMALERIAIDLDDGVKVNYEKVQTDSKGKFHQILAKIK